MSAVTTEMLAQSVKKVGALPEPDWKSHQLRKGWDGVSKVMLKALDEMKANGVTKPLGKLQELAFEEALERADDRPLQAVALWLTDSRIWLEEYIASKDAGLRELLERRGLVKPKGTADVAP